MPDAECVRFTPAGSRRCRSRHVRAQTLQAPGRTKKKLLIPQWNVD